MHRVRSFYNVTTRVEIARRKIGRHLPKQTLPVQLFNFTLHFIEIRPPEHISLLLLMSVHNCSGTGEQRGGSFGEAILRLPAISVPVWKTLIPLAFGNTRHKPAHQRTSTRICYTECVDSCRTYHTVAHQMFAYIGSVARPH